MSDDKFENADAVKAWLREQQVPEDFAIQVAHTLFENNYVYPSTLRNITREQLHVMNIIGPISNTLFNKLKDPPPQQQDVRHSQPQNENGSPDHFAPILLNLAMKSMEIGWDNISEKGTKLDSTIAKRNSITFYGLENEQHCQVLGPDTKYVRTAHLWPHNNMENLPLVDLVATDIDNPKNVLRLHSDIENKFDRFSLTFVPSGNDFFLKVLDPSINNFILRDTTVTFEDLDGKPLLFPSENRPWRRILGTHSILAHRKARNNGYLISDQLTEAESSAQELLDFSVDREAQARIRMVFSNP